MYAKPLAKTRVFEKNLMRIGRLPIEVTSWCLEIHSQNQLVRVFQENEF
jgi:hypothetical protein